MRNEKTVCAHSYAGITRIRFEGPGGYTPISAGMRQHPLDCGTTIILFFLLSRGDGRVILREKKEVLFLKKMRKIIAFLLALAMALTLCACAKPTPIAAGKNTVGVKDGETLGQGATAFTVEVTDAQGTKTDFTVKTDEKTVGAALQALNIISGEESDYGLYIKEVIGITADYDTDGTYWAFYIDGQYAATGVDMTDAQNGAVYGFAVEKVEA